MGRAYSVDLRERIAGHVVRGGSRREAGRRFGVCNHPRAPLVIGDGTWYFFTGTNCCIDTMTHPVAMTLSGIGSVDPGTGPGGTPGPSPVPVPAAFPLLGGAMSLLGLVGIRRRRTA